MIQGPDGTWTNNEYVTIDEMGINGPPNPDDPDKVNDSFQLEEEEDDEFPEVVWEVYPYALRYLDLSDCGKTIGNPTATIIQPYHSYLTTLTSPPFPS